MRCFIGFIVLVLMTASATAQVDTIAERYAQEIDIDDLRKHLTIIASDEFEGRETGYKGQKLAEKYLVDYFEKLGLKPGNNGVFTQEFDVVTYNPDANISFCGKTISFLEEFYCYDKYEKDLLKKEVVFIGYGIDNPNYSDYKNIDVKGKIVMYFEDEPYSKGKSLISGRKEPSAWSYNWRKKLETAKNRGAIGAMSIVKDYANRKRLVAEFLSSPRMSLAGNKQTLEVTDIPVLFLSEKLGFDILSQTKKGRKPKKLMSWLSKGKAKAKFNTGVDIDIDFLPNGDIVQSSNVLAFLEGTDKKEEIVVITAHYDHIGTNGELIYNGADDDGSGTVSLMEIAQAFKTAKQNGHGPRRSILFMPVSGEEKGLLGSEYYAEHPVYPMEKTVADLNIDMIGRHDTMHTHSNYVYLIGSNRLSSELHNISEQANKTYTQLELDYTYNAEDDPNEFYYRSDHYNFARKGVPVIFYFSGVHEDYHKSTDTVEKIEFEKMSKIAKLIFFTAWELANRAEKITVDQPVEWD